MGQKANPASLRVGGKTGWHTSFSEKKIRDVGNNTQVLELEVKEFLTKILNDYGFCLQNCKIEHYDSSLKIFIHVFSTNHQFAKTRDKNNDQAPTSANTVVWVRTKNESSLIQLRSSNYKYVKTSTLNTISKSLSERLGHKKVALITTYVNSALNMRYEEKKYVKKSFLSLRRFKKEPFFIESLNAAVRLTKDSKATAMLLKAIVYYLKTTKRIGLILKFFKKSLTLLVGSPNNSIKGLKLKIKGRLTRSRRSRSYIITIGDVPIHTRSVELTYDLANSQNANGSYGVKLWVVHDG